MNPAGLMIMGDSEKSDADEADATDQSSEEPESEEAIRNKQNESSLVDRLWAQPEFKGEVLRLYNALLHVRHAFRSHFEPLDPNLRDYGLPDFFGATPEVAAEEFDRVLLADAQAMLEGGGNDKSGTEGTVVFNDTPEIQK